jgi:hypothetical protein
MSILLFITKVKGTFFGMSCPENLHHFLEFEAHDNIFCRYPSLRRQRRKERDSASG